MKHVLLAGIFATVFSMYAQYAPAITLSGEITGNETWSGTVQLTGDVTVIEPGKLTILAGTRIECATQMDDSAGGRNTSRIELIVNWGSLEAVGTETEPILFTSASPNPERGDWYGLRITSDTTTMRHCIVEYGNEGIRVEGGIPEIEQCTVRENSGSGIHFELTGAVSDCDIQNNGQDGILSDVGTVTTTNSTLSNNGRDGMHGNAIMTGCTMDGNGNDGAEGGTLNLTNCTITNNGADGIRCGKVILKDSAITGNTGRGVAGDTLDISNTPVNGNSSHGVEGRIITVTNSDVRQNGDIGIYAHNSSDTSSEHFGHISQIDIRNSTITDNVNSGVYGQGAYRYYWSSYHHGGSNILIIDSVIRGNGGHGVIARDEDQRPSVVTISASTINYNNGYGVYGRTVSANDCIIRGNSETGIRTLAIGADGISGNEMRANLNGITLSFSEDMELSGNAIYSNTEFELKNQGAGAITANGNYWGPFTNGELQQGVSNLTKIWDSRDEESRGQVFIGNYIDSESIDSANTFVFNPSNPNANNQFSGEISTPVTWSDTIYLTGDVTVTDTGNLTILPGTRVIFEPKYDDQIGGRHSSRIELIVEWGSLEAVGTETEPILFTSASPNPERGDWYGLRITSDTTTMRHCIVEYGNEGIRVEGGIPEIEQCTVRENSGSGIHFELTGAVSDCDIQNNGQDGILSDVGTVTTTNSTLSNNGRDGMHGNAIMTGCTMDGNGNDGAEGGTLNLTNCTITNNGADGIRCGKVILKDSAITGNTGRGVAGDTLDISNTPVNGNSSHGVEGRIITVTNSDVRQNGDIGIYAHNSSDTSSEHFGHISQIDIRNSTITDNVNSGVYGQGAYRYYWSSYHHGGSNILIIDSVIRGNGGHGVIARDEDQQPSVVTISASTINYNNGYGVYGRAVSANGCVVRGNSETGIRTMEIGAEGISGNEMRANLNGITLASSEDMELSGNAVYSNTEFELKNLGAGAITANGNYWGPFTTEELNAGTENLTKIFDCKDDASKGCVYIENYLDAPFESAPDIKLIVDITDPEDNEEVTYSPIDLEGVVSLTSVEGSRGVLDLIFVLDTSGSLRGSLGVATDPDNYRSKAAANLIESIPASADVRIGVVDFDGNAKVVQPLTDNRENAISIIMGLDRDGDTNIEAGIRAALSEFASNGRDAVDRFIILFSDGGERSGNALSALPDVEMPIHTLYLGEPDSEGGLLLETIAATTNGTFQHITDPTQLPNLFADVGAASFIDRVELVSDAAPGELVLAEVSANFWKASGVVVRTNPKGQVTTITVTAYTNETPPRVSTDTVKVVAGLDTFEPTPTATPDIQDVKPTPTATPTEKPPATPTPEPTRQHGIHDGEPVYIYPMNEDTASENNLQVLNPTGYDLGNYLFDSLETTASAQVYTDGFGMKVNLEPETGITAYGKPLAVEPDTYVFLRISAYCNNPNVSIAVGALDAVEATDISGAALNGSIGSDMLTESGRFVENFGYLETLFMPERGAIVPVFQAVNLSQNSARAQFDNLEIYVIPKIQLPVRLKSTP